MTAPHNEGSHPITLGAAANSRSADALSEEAIRQEQARIHAARQRVARQEYEALAAQGDQHAAFIRKRLGRQRLRNGLVTTVLVGVFTLFVLAQADAHGESTNPLVAVFCILAVILVVSAWTASPAPKAEREAMRYQRERKRGKR